VIAKDILKYATSYFSEPKKP